MSAGTCSRISAATTRSNSPSANGSARASPSLMSASAPSGTSPASFMAANSSRTPASSSPSWSKAMTSAPRRYISNACRPAPHPRSSTRSPGSRPSRSKSTVSIRTLPTEIADGLLVRRRHGLGDRAPAEVLEHTLTSGPPHALAPGVVVQERGDRVLEGAHVTGGHEVGALTVRADDLGDRAGVGGHQRGAAGHELGGREAEPLVQGRDAGQLRRTHEVDQLLVGQPVDEADVLGDAEGVDQLLGPAARLRLAHEHQLEVALDPELGEGLQQGRDALHRGV